MKPRPKREITFLESDTCGKSVLGSFILYEINGDTERGSESQ